MSLGAQVPPHPHSTRSTLGALTISHIFGSERKASLRAPRTDPGSRVWDHSNKGWGANLFFRRRAMGKPAVPPTSPRESLLPEESHVLPGHWTTQAPPTPIINQLHHAREGNFRKQPCWREGLGEEATAMLLWSLMALVTHFLARPPPKRCMKHLGSSKGSL